ncbi:MAG: transposase [Candidatus Moeniiplasma glomeromycotorum]|nr:transposase [Candidatus Moeniiplasma glomeromycotorum]MCE8168397.1 transposase [Candidatus Moeniiplasma glomeromycotorum]MCE8169719.1 transposase [Candidatus Moeniiplasma glomeromycotorum]
MPKSFKYRLYPSQKQKEQLEKTLETCRILYNDFLAERKDKYEKEKGKITCFEQINSLPNRKETNSFLKEVHSQVLQDIARRVNKSFQNFFRRLKAQAGKAGYPRFKQYGRYDSFTYPQSGFNLKHSQLILSHLDKINIEKHRKLEGKIKTCSIIIKNGKFYVCFSCENIKVKRSRKTKKKVGIDMGLTSFLATSNGELKEAPKTYRKSEKELAKAQRKVSRRVKKSRRRKKSVRILAVKHEKVANQRKDLAHKLSRELVEKYDLIAHEKLQIKNMVKNRYLAKSITDAGWSLFLTILTYKVVETGKRVVEVDAKNTSQICNQCGEKRKEKLKLSQRIFKCSHCNYKDNRDINAARNILKRAEGLGTSLQGAVSLEAV